MNANFRGVTQVKYDKFGKEIWRAIYCHREGSRDRKYVELVNRSRKAQRLTRFGCKARISVRYDRTRGYFRFGTFVEEHNHELALDTFVPYFRACRRVSRPGHSHGHAGLQYSHLRGVRLHDYEPGWISVPWIPLQRYVQPS